MQTLQAALEIICWIRLISDPRDRDSFMDPKTLPSDTEKLQKTVPKNSSRKRTRKKHQVERFAKDDSLS